MQVKRHKLVDEKTVQINRLTRHLKGEFHSSLAGSVCAKYIACCSGSREDRSSTCNHRPERTVHCARLKET
jgi:hypothetical protein